MATSKEYIKTIQKKFNDSLKKIKTESELEQARVTFLGRNGEIAQLMAQLKTLPVEEKKVIGPLLNKLKIRSQNVYENKQKELHDAILDRKIQQQKLFDVTAYKYETTRGSIHVYTHLIEKLEDVFISMGYDIADGPEIETDYYNFSALNIPPDHPARDIQDTFWLYQPNRLLRTHTSPVQIRTMETKGVPLAIFAPGRVYRNEETDASHDFLFMQAEGLLIDKNISMGNLLATARTFLQAIFEKDDLSIRVRPGYFPFVEPGVEIDASCPFCSHGCSTCKQTGWIELMGSGLVHPNVLKTSGIDPTIYSGFAFGFGIERIAMIKYDINDIRLFHSSKLSFLDQF